MKSSFFTFLVVVALGHLPVGAADWPSWRGPNGDNTTPETRFPLEWDTKKNVIWRTELPGPGNSSPIVWGNKVFITQAERNGAERSLHCFDRATGKLLWESTTPYELTEKSHDTNPQCSSSPVTDGERVIASFGSAGVVCTDLNGKELWRANLGPQVHNWGYGSSPVLHGDLCVIYHGPGTPSRLVALDKKTGKQRWQADVPEQHPAERFDGFAGKNDGAMGSFATPTILKVGNRTEVIMGLSNKVRSFDLQTGKELWTCDGMNPLVYSSFTPADGAILAMGGYFGSTMLVKTGGAGNVTGTHRVWYEQRAKRHRIGSPVVKDGHAYIYNTIGFAECIQLKDGKQVWEERIKASSANGEAWGSFVLAGERLYGVNQSGDTVVLKASPTFEVLATNPLGEKSNGTPAFSNGQIFIRTHQALWCIGDKGGSGQRAAVR